MGSRLDKTMLENTNIEIMCHLPDQCEGEVCSIHNRSDHSMRSFPQHWRGDRGIMERTCPHGVGHPDPDDYRVRNGEDDGVHGCDGCCYDENHSPEELPAPKKTPYEQGYWDGYLAGIDKAHWSDWDVG